MAHKLSLRNSHSTISRVTNTASSDDHLQANERKQTEEALSKSKEQMAFALETTGIGAWELNLVDNTAYHSPIHDLIFGYTPPLPKWTYEMFIAHVVPEDRDLVDGKFRHAMEAKSDWNFECRIRRADGEKRWIWAKGQHLRGSNGIMSKMSGIVQDITEHKQTEELLREATAKVVESESFQKLIKEANPDLIFVKDLHFNIVDANSVFLNAYPEDRRDKVIGYTTLEEYDDEEAEKFLAMDRKAFEEGYSETTEAISFPDGRRRILYTQKTRFKNNKGEPFILGISRDVTEREQLIQSLVTSNDELERFAYVASHDMQEPLRMITSFSEIIMSEYGDKLDVQGKEYLKMVFDSGVRMRAMVADLLEYSRIGNEGMHFTEFDGANALASVLTNLNGLITEKRAEITCDKLPQLQGNTVQFIRLLQNLITNAIKYQPSSHTPHIHIGIIDQGSHWSISVKDNGLGISERFTQKIFQPFSRLHSYQEIGGTGLGLTICKKIVEGHGGTIWVTSVPEEGTTAFFTIAKELVPLSEVV